jgi:hypothetical protein
MTPLCVGCNKTPDQLPCYAPYAAGARMTPDEYVRREEGTYNPENGHFLCDDCYHDAGMPSSQRGWVAP